MFQAKFIQGSEEFADLSAGVWTFPWYNGYAEGKIDGLCSIVVKLE